MLQFSFAITARSIQSRPHRLQRIKSSGLLLLCEKLSLIRTRCQNCHHLGRACLRFAVCLSPGLLAGSDSLASFS